MKPVSIVLGILFLSWLYAASIEIPPIRELPNGKLEVSAICYVHNISPEEAVKRAVEKACEDAVQYSSGVQVNSYLYSLQSESEASKPIDSIMSLLKLSAAGVVTEKQLIKEESLLDGNTLVKRVTVQLKVAKQKGKSDPSFKLTASLNKHTFVEGDELELSVTPSLDCYLMVFNICSNDTVYCIYPNAFQAQTLVCARSKFTLPDLEAKNKGLALKPTLLPGRDTDMEIIKVLAVKNASYIFPFSAQSQYGSISSLRESFLQWLVSIPRDQIEETDLPYSVHMQ